MDLSQSALKVGAESRTKFLIESRRRPSSDRSRGRPRVFARGDAAIGCPTGRPSLDGLWRQGEGLLARAHFIML